MITGGGEHHTEVHVSDADSSRLTRTACRGQLGLGGGNWVRCDPLALLLIHVSHYALTAMGIPIHPERVLGVAGLGATRAVV